MLKKIEKFFIITLFIVLIIILIIKVFFPNKINQIFKYNILIVQSNSMYPELEKGNILICKKQKDIYSITNTVYSCLYFGSSIYFSYSPDFAWRVAWVDHSTAMPPAGKTAASLP